MVDWAEDIGLANKILEDIGTDLAESDKTRAKGTHVSQLIYCLTRSYYDQTSPLPLNPQEAMLFSTGIGLETVLLRPRMKAPSGEKDGIHCPVDGLNIEGPVPLVEFKSTRLSASKGPEELPKTWVKQIMAYMYATEQREATLAVLHLMGSYHPPFPVLKCWRMTATDKEVWDNWQWLLDRKRILEAHLVRQEAPKQFKWNEPWECTTGPCKYLLLCQANQSIEDIRAKS